jgi:hypothetical protein
LNFCSLAAASTSISGFNKLPLKAPVEPLASPEKSEYAANANCALIK